jgi:anti-sigma B factor antagonist
VHGEEGALVHLNGRVNIDSSPRLRDRLLAILDREAPENVTVDLAEVPYIDTSGIATLLEALKIARARNNTLSLKGLQDTLLHVLEVTGLAAVFGLSRDPGAASASRVS